jgi:hypothetical protein
VKVEHPVIVRALIASCVLVVGCGGAPQAATPQHPISDPLDDQNAQQLFDAGVRIASQGDYIRAEQYLTAARDHGYPEDLVLPMLMEVCVHSSRYSAAVGYAEPYIETHPDDWRLRLLLASIQTGLGNAAAARLSLEHVVAEAPDEALPHYMLGVLLRDELHDETGSPPPASTRARRARRWASSSVRPGRCLCAYNPRTCRRRRRPHRCPHELPEGGHL